MEVAEAAVAGVVEAAAVGAEANLQAVVSNLGGYATREAEAVAAVVCSEVVAVGL